MPEAFTRARSSSVRVLVLCHLSAAAAAVAAIQKEAPARSVYLLAYGRSAGTLSMRGVTHVRLPSLSGGALARSRRLVRFVADLRERRFHEVVIAQPALHRSRARGLLMAFPFLLRPGKVRVLDPETGQWQGEVNAVYGGFDLLRWVMLHLGAEIAAAAATRVATRLTTSGHRRQIPPTGSVVYLRTDVDLATAPLVAGGSVAHTEGVVRSLARRGHGVEFWATGSIAGMPLDVRERRLRVLVMANLPTEIAELASGIWQGMFPPTKSRMPTGFVYQRYSLNNFSGLLLARRWRVPLVLEVNSSEAQWRETWSSLTFPKLARATERAIFQVADRIVTVSENASRGVYAAGAPPFSVRVVPNGVEIDRFSVAAATALPFPPDSFVIAFVGQFYPWHGVQFLAEAFAIVHGQRPASRLLLVGDGEQSALVREILARAGVADATYMPGVVGRDEVPGLLAASDVVVSPHAHDDKFVGSPIKLFEYMASGRPIVASDMAQLRTVLDHDRTALMVPPSNPTAIAEALVRLHDDPPLRDRLGAAASAEARARHSWDAHVDAILDNSGG